MEDDGQRGRSSRIPGVGYRKGDYSLRMESEVKEDKFIKNNNIRKDIKKVYEIIYRLSDGVVEHERMEEDIEEYINVMVYQEESIDVDVDKKSNQSFKGSC